MEEAKKHGGVWEMLSQAVLPFSLALVLWTRLCHSRPLQRALP